jgi:UDP-N-acetylmuramyl pentapeptide synthase
LEAVVPLPGRMETLMLPGGIHVINDAYNANPASMALSVHTLQSLKGNGRGIFVAGDMMELGDHAERAHRELGVLITRAGTTHLYATGEFAEALTEGATGAGMDPKRIFIGNHEEIVAQLGTILRPGDWVLVKGSRRMAMERVVEGLQAEISKRES